MASHDDLSPRAADRDDDGDDDDPDAPPSRPRAPVAASPGPCRATDEIALAARTSQILGDFQAYVGGIGAAAGEDDREGAASDAGEGDRAAAASGAGAEAAAGTRRGADAADAAARGGDGAGRTGRGERRGRKSRRGSQGVETAEGWSRGREHDKARLLEALSWQRGEGELQREWTYAGRVDPQAAAGATHARDRGARPRAASPRALFDPRALLGASGLAPKLRGGAVVALLLVALGLALHGPARRADGGAADPALAPGEVGAAAAAAGAGPAPGLRGGAAVALLLGGVAVGLVAGYATGGKAEGDGGVEERPAREWPLSEAFSIL